VADTSLSSNGTNWVMCRDGGPNWVSSRDGIGGIVVVCLRWVVVRGRVIVVATSLRDETVRGRLSGWSLGRARSAVVAARLAGVVNINGGRIGVEVERLLDQFIGGGDAAVDNVFGNPREDARRRVDSQGRDG